MHRSKFELGIHKINLTSNRSDEGMSDDDDDDDVVMVAAAWRRWRARRREGEREGVT